MPIPLESFSRRFGLRPTPPESTAYQVPDAVRAKLIPLVDQYRNNGLPGATSLGPTLYERVGRISPQGSGDMAMIRRLFVDAECWQIYDLCEILVSMCSFRQQLADRIDAIFAEEGVPYCMTTEGIRWRFREATAEALAEATGYLVDQPTLRGPAEQWRKASGHLSERPPDTENCIKDAVGAVEGTARILSGRTTEALSTLMRPFAQAIGMHGALTGIVEKLYAYRGDEQAVAHGATRPPGDLTAEAEFVLHTSAATIIYFARKSPRAG